MSLATHTASPRPRGTIRTSNRARRAIGGVQRLHPLRHAARLDRLDPGRDANPEDRIDVGDGGPSRPDVRPTGESGRRRIHARRAARSLDDDDRVRAPLVIGTNRTRCSGRPRPFIAVSRRCPTFHQISGRHPLIGRSCSMPRPSTPGRLGSTGRFWLRWAEAASRCGSPGRCRSRVRRGWWRRPRFRCPRRRSGC